MLSPNILAEQEDLFVPMRSCYNKFMEADRGSQARFLPDKSGGEFVEASPVPTGVRIKLVGGREVFVRDSRDLAHEAALETQLERERLGLDMV